MDEYAVQVGSAIHIMFSDAILNDMKAALDGFERAWIDLDVNMPVKPGLERIGSIHWDRHRWSGQPVTIAEVRTFCRRNKLEWLRPRIWPRADSEDGRVMFDGRLPGDPSQTYRLAFIWLAGGLIPRELARALTTVGLWSSGRDACESSRWSETLGTSIIPYRG